MLQLSLARELGCTLAELLERITPEELVLWNMFFRIEREEEAKAAKKRK
jgi:hypothetical protein